MDAQTPNALPTRESQLASLQRALLQVVEERDAALEHVATERAARIAVEAERDVQRDLVEHLSLPVGYCAAPVAAWAQIQARAEQAEASLAALTEQRDRARAERDQADETLLRCQPLLGSARAERDALRTLVGYLNCPHTDRTGGNDYQLCNDCGLMWDYRRETSSQKETQLATAALASRAGPQGET